MRARSVVSALAVSGLLAGCSSSTGGSGSGTPGTQSSAARTASSTAASSSTSTSPSASASSSSASSATHPVPATPLLTKAVVAPGSGTTYVVKVWAQTQTNHCAAHAYGRPVVAYLTKHRCTTLTRRLVTTTVNGRDVGFAQNSLGFSGTSQAAVYRAAGNFRTLVTKDGTGNLNDLLREGYRLPSGPMAVPSPDAFLALAQDNSVSIVDAWYLRGATPDNDRALIQMAKDVYLQF